MKRLVVKYPILSALALAVLVLGLGCSSLTVHAANDAYSDGNYGACQYGSCSITLTSSGTVNLNVTPGSSTTCTVQSDSVAVTTDSSTGYTLSLNDAAATSAMSGTNGGTVNVVSGSNASPAALTANTWGYRVDGTGGFGTGPTSATSNAGVPSTTFAAVPNSSATPDTLINSSSPADPAVTTPVWYGLCANTTIPNGTYASSVIYTAVVN